MWLHLLLLIFSVRAQDDLCPEEKTPKQLAAVSVWMQNVQNGSLRFKISDEDLLDKGFSRSPYDRDSAIIMMAEYPGTCPVGACLMKLTANRRVSDGSLIQQENVFGPPSGFISMGDELFCARKQGDCGAEMPIFRFTKGRPNDMVVGYSIDPVASIPGYWRDAKPICYGWSDSGSIITTHGKDNGDCVRLQEIKNAKIRYSYPGSGAYFPVGTTASVACSRGFAAGGSSTVLCTKHGWYPGSGLGYCVKQNASSRASSTGLISSGSASQLCAPPSSIENAQISYTQLQQNGRFPAGTTATVVCSSGYTVSTGTRIECQDGKWSREQWPKCVKSDKVKCQPMLEGPNGQIIYNSSVEPLTLGSNGTLRCDLGFVPIGTVRTECTETGWKPPTLGICQVRDKHRNKRQLSSSATCTAVAPLGGTPSYVQSNPTVPYSAGTSVLLICNPGYVLSGSGSSICLNGLWSPPIGSCAPSGFGVTVAPGLNAGNSGASCLDFMQPPTGNIQYTLLPSNFGTHPTGTLATLTCNIGTTVSGSLASSCQNGIWSPVALGTCTATSLQNSLLECANPVIPNAQITYSQSTAAEAQKPVGSVATIVCNLGYNIQGTGSLTCQSSGLWSPLPPMCVASGFGGVVPSLQCPAMATPLSGTLSYSSVTNPTGPFNTGTIATLICNAGSIASGPASASCNSGVWSPATIGSCTQSGLPGGGVVGFGGELQCPAMITPISGIINYSLAGGITYPSGTIATVVCTSGILFGAGSASCFNGAWTPPVLGQCSLGGAKSLNSVSTLAPGTGCPAMIPQLGVSITYSNGANLGPFPSGTLATAACSTFGQAVQGAMSAQCLGTNWSTVLGSCSTDIGGVNNTPNSSCSFGITAPLGSTLVYSKNNQPFGPFPTGTVATAKCTAFSPNTPGGAQTSMCVSGVWTPSVITGCSAQADPPVVGGVSTGVTSNTCPTIPAPWNGQITYSTGTPFLTVPSGSMATLTCTSGTLSGSVISSCFNGQWTPAIGNCSTGTPGVGGAQCTTPPAMPVGASAAFSNGASIFGPWSDGTTATITCPFGQVASGIPTVTCRSGSWGTSLVTCSTSGLQAGATTGAPGLPGSTCPVLFAPPFGTINYSQGGTLGPFPVGSQATLSCSPPFTVTGTQMVSCLNGQWTTQIGNCQTGGTSGAVTNAPGLTGTCTTILTPPFGTLTYSQAGPFGPFPSGSQATLSCSAPFSVQGTQTSSCQNGQWLPLLGTCQTGTGTATTANPGAGSLSCAATLAPAFGIINYSQAGPFGPFPPGTTATVTCSPPFSIQGTATSTCSSGQWSPPFGTCQTGVASATGAPGTGATGGATCSAVLAPAFGTVNYSQAGPFGPFPQSSTASLSCSLGFWLSGSGSSSCSNGQWTPPLGTCNSGGPIGNPTTNSPGFNNGVTCTAASAPPFGTLTYSQAGPFGPFPQSTTASLSCSLGFSLTGSGSSSCSNGQWTPPLGTCNSGGPVGNLTTGNQVGSQCATSIPLVAFGSATFSNGQFLPPWPQGTTVSLQCLPSFTVNGSATSTCTNGQWNPVSLGSCKPPSVASPFTQCQAVPMIFSGTVQYSPQGPPFNEGATATLVCNPGTTVSGLTTATCRNGGWSPFPGLGSCVTSIQRNPTRSVNQSLRNESCLSPPAPPFSEITFSNMSEHGTFAPETEAVMDCVLGYTAQGATKAICKDGSFRPLLGNCHNERGQRLPGTCMPLTTPLNGMVSYIQASKQYSLEVGTIALLSCKNNYAVTGTATVHCTPTGWSPSQGFGQCDRMGNHISE